MGWILIKLINKIYAYDSQSNPLITMSWINTEHNFNSLYHSHTLKTQKSYISFHNKIKGSNGKETRHR